MNKLEIRYEVYVKGIGAIAYEPSRSYAFRTAYRYRMETGTPVEIYERNGSGRKLIKK